MIPSFDASTTASSPFPHMHVPRILGVDDADRLLAWLRDKAPWSLRVESFYEQHEFSLQATGLDGPVPELLAPQFIDRVRSHLTEGFAVPGRLELVDVSAHRLTPGQTIRIHNDFIGDEETHRLLIQLNEGWDVERGGLLMLFSDDDPASVRQIILPAHGSGFAFEISDRSYHAVSSIKDGQRFTLVYTFKRSHGVGS